MRIGTKDAEKEATDAAAAATAAEEAAQAARRPLQLPDDKQSLFEVGVSLATECSGLLLEPKAAAFGDSVSALLAGMVEMCCSVERMLENGDLVEGVVGESDVEVATPMRDLILDDDFDEHKSRCQELMETSYAEVNDFVERYEPYRYAPDSRACFVTSAEHYG